MTGCHGMVVATTGQAPAVRVRVGEQVRLQLRLRGQQATDPDGGDRLTRGGHAQSLGQVPGDAQRVLRPA